LSGVKVRLAVAEGDAQFCAVIVDVDETTGRARSIERIFKPFERKRMELKNPSQRLDPGLRRDDGERSL